MAKLSEYKKKRNLKKTAEPSKDGRVSKKIPKFVIQKHAARRLHYDLRLEIDGVFKSWALPKGPSLSPKDKRLAVMTEDHPLAYGNFEGEIPQGEYGAGTVMIWDRGTYRNSKKKDAKLVPMKTCLKNGQIEIVLKGKKLKGGFALVRFRGEEHWLLIKMRDQEANEKKDVLKADRSVKSDRSMKEIHEQS